MSYNKFLMEVFNKLMLASNISITQNEPYNACLFYENLNSLLPSAEEMNNGGISENNETDENKGNSIKNTIDESVFGGEQKKHDGYRVNVDEFRPKIFDKDDYNTIYLTEHLNADKDTWNYYRRLSNEVLKAFLRYQSDMGEVS